MTSMLTHSRLIPTACGGIGASTIRIMDGAGDGILLGITAAGTLHGTTVAGMVLAIGAGEATGVAIGDTHGIATIMQAGTVMAIGAVTMHGTDQAVVIRAFTPIVT